jgi:serine/threonine protein phosphatase PrpC
VTNNSSKCKSFSECSAMPQRVCAAGAMIPAQSTPVNDFELPRGGAPGVIFRLEQYATMSTNLQSTLQVAALTHVGRRRHANEDCIAVGARLMNDASGEPWFTVHDLSSPCVCLVADGMGGHPAGDVASRMVIEQLSVQLPDAIGADDTLIAALRATNRALFAAMTRRPSVLGMGSTIAGIAAERQGIVIFNVGDSRIYRIRGGRLTQISIDDSEAVMTAFMSFEFPARALSQCLGGFPGADEIHPHVLREQAESGCTYLICSDGLYDMLSDHAIAACLSESLDQSIRALFERAMDAGGNDNISIILARVQSSESA